MADGFIPMILLWLSVWTNMFQGAWQNSMVVPVSSASTTCSNSSRWKLNPELMNKYNPLKELNTQKVFLATATKRKANEMNNASDKISAKKD